MHARIITGQAKPGELDNFIDTFQNSVIPAGRGQRGFISMQLFVDRATGHGVVVSAWETEADLRAGEDSGYFQEQVAKLLPFLVAPPTREIFALVAEGGA